MEKEWKHEYMSANNEHHVPLHVKPIQSKKGGVTEYKHNNDSEVIQIEIDCLICE